MSALDRASIDALDSGHMLADILAMHEQLGDAVWRVQSAGIESVRTPDGLVIAGSDGSSIGGVLATAALGERASRPILAARGYALPPWTTSETTVLCMSYSGAGEETLACFEAAGTLGCRRVVATTGGELAAAARAEGVPVIPLPGGFEPRAAAAYMLVSTLEVAALCGAAAPMTAEIDAAAAPLAALAAGWAPEAGEDGEAVTLARRLDGTVPVIVGAGPTAALAERWRLQMIDNAGVPAFSSELLRAERVTLCEGEDGGAPAALSAIFLDDRDCDPRLRHRLSQAARLVAPGAAPIRVETQGDSALARVCSLILLGDLVSCYLAALRDADPTAAPPLAELKELLTAAV